MARTRNKKQPHDMISVLDAASPPAPTKNNSFRIAHDEIPMLQNISRVFLGILIESLGDGRKVSWDRFITDYTPHRKISGTEEIKTFLLSKLTAKKR